MGPKFASKALRIRSTTVLSVHLGGKKWRDELGPSHVPITRGPFGTPSWRSGQVRLPDPVIAYT